MVTNIAGLQMQNNVNVIKVEQDTRNDVVFDVKTSVFRSMAVNGCNWK